MSTGAPYLGISLGTANFSMAWFNPVTDQAEVILNVEGEPKTPSLVYYADDDEVLVGSYVENLIAETEDLNDEVEREYVSARIVRGVLRNLASPPVISIPGGKLVRPVEVVSEILRKLKHDAEAERFYEEVGHAVISCPALLGQRERETLLEAARSAGFQRAELLDETVAVAAAADRLAGIGRGALVYDLGVSTFDLTAVERGDQGDFRISVAPQGDPRCGGDDFDLAIYRHCDQVAIEEIGRPIDPAGSVDQAFLRQCRLRKEMLSHRSTVRFSSFLVSEDGLARFTFALYRETFEGLIREDVEKTVLMTAEMFERVRDRVDRVVVVGGSSRIPLVKRRLAEALPIQPLQFTEIEHAAALEAAYHAHDLWTPKL